METPSGSGRLLRTASPRLPERKKQLFRSRMTLLDEVCDDVEDPLLGISPLKSRSQRQQTGAVKQTKVHSLLKTSESGNSHYLRLRSSTSSSPETNKENKSKSAQNTRGGPEATRISDEQLPNLFTKTMRLNSNSSTRQESSPCTPTTHKRSTDSDMDTDDSEFVHERKATKREHWVDIAGTSDSSPQNKIKKECIPTMAFYSHATCSRSSLRTSVAGQSDTAQHGAQQKQRGGRTKTVSPKSRSKVGINKGVSHKIRKPMRHGASIDLDGILGTIRNEKLRLLITTKREERANAEKVHEILRSAKDPIKMAKPLSVIESSDANNNNNSPAFCLSNIDFSDLSDNEELITAGATNVVAHAAIDLEPVIPLIRHDSLPNLETEGLAKRKFFKSGRRSSTNMEVRITDNIRASVSQGKIALLEAPPRKPRQVRVRSATIFSAEQATVDAILRNLDDTVVDEIIESNSMPQPQTECPALNAVNPLELYDPFAKYRQKIPYQTDDSAIIEQQNLLLEFLISNGICTDENFEIFIADPDNHKEEATRIVDKLYMVVYAEQETKEPPPSPSEPTVQTEAIIDNNPIEERALPAEPQGKLFPIFTQRLQPMPQKSSRRKLNLSTRLTAGAAGSSQYQIDAGQKAFGARQCHQCGLVYTVHEPEEEQLHHFYHNAMHVLRFKGWIDEDIVAVCPEWAADGRIIRINEQAPAARRLRLSELLRVVDKELGYSSYIVPKTFVAYFAVRKQQVVGMCLVQPLTQAHRFIQIDGTDYFSEETFDASCGISRIWVSPLHRRQGIANKLLCSVQRHTILGSEISRDRIAFSTPTDDGRALARYFTQNDNFLTYDQ